MMKTKNSAHVRRTVALAVLAGFVLASLPVRAAYVITTQGQRVDGTDIRAKSDGEIVLTTPAGIRTFYKGQYTQAVADKPPEIDRAVQLVDAKKFDDAIKMLDDVVLKYRFLAWDVQARKMLPVVYSRKGDFGGAIASYEKLFALEPKSRDEAEVAWAYRQALLDAKQYDKLETVLNDVIATGTRADAARAQIMRGDIRMAQNQLEPAVLDYLRTVVLYKSEKSVQPEAVKKASDALEKLRDPRAAELRKLLN